MQNVLQLTTFLSVRALIKWSATHSSSAKRYQKNVTHAIHHRARIMESAELSTELRRACIQSAFRMKTAQQVRLASIKSAEILVSKLVELMHCATLSTIRLSVLVREDSLVPHSCNVLRFRNLSHGLNAPPTTNVPTTKRASIRNVSILAPVRVVFADRTLSVTCKLIGQSVSAVQDSLATLSTTATKLDVDLTANALQLKLASTKSVSIHANSRSAVAMQFAKQITIIKRVAIVTKVTVGIRLLAVNVLNAPSTTTAPTISHVKMRDVWTPASALHLHNVSSAIMFHLADAHLGSQETLQDPAK